MQRIIRNRSYDTATATLIQRFIRGAYGDPAGYEECLYRTPEGHLFLYSAGGADSPHPTETIRRVSVATAEQWQKEHPETVL